MYNGWKNVETWTCYSWLTMYDFYQTEAAQEALAEADGNKEFAVGILAEKIHEELIENAPIDSGLYSDLLGIAIDNADYYEIAEAFLEE